MKRKLILSCLPFLCVAFSLPSQADIYKHVDADGRVTYSNVKLKGSTKLDLEPADSKFGNVPKPASQRTEPSKSATPSDFPKVDNSTQNQRDAKRKEILMAELEAEKQALARAKQAFAEGEANPEMAVGAQGRRFRNVPKFEEKMRPLQEAVDAHQRNIDLLTKELNQ